MSAPAEGNGDGAEPREEGAEDARDPTSRELGNRHTEPAPSPRLSGETTGPIGSSPASGETTGPTSGEIALGRVPIACPACKHENPPGSRFCNACGQGLYGEEARVERPGADPLVGRIIAGRYRIDEVIGRGGMGVVYRVEHVRMGKLMAMKLLHGDLARDKEVVRRFSREAEAVSKLDHPNTVQVFDFGESDGMTWLVMELLSGRDLGAVLSAEGTLDFSRAARIAWQIASSVEQAHERGIVHRDLKPENVRLLADRSEPDFVKVMDFGLAKLRETEEQKRASITRDGFLVGTPYYMAPEHIRGDTVDARTDVYALGAMIYKMIAGMPPFWAPTPVAVLTKHLSDEPVAPSRRSPRRDLPPEADAIVLRCLEKSPDDRYRSMNELKEALTDYLESVGKGPKSARFTVPKVELKTESGRKIQVATRDDVDRFERGLRTTGTLGTLLVVALAIATGAVAWWAWGARAPEAPTAESEPNDAPATADEIWAGTPIEGRIGARIDTNLGDSDVYRIVGLGPDDRFIRIDASGLPNLDFVAELYLHGRTDPLLVIDGDGLGAPERVPLYPIDPSSHYLLRVRESIPIGRLPTENVSDTYLLSVSTATPEEGSEREPNDGASRGERIAIGDVRTGFVGWQGDVDSFCLEAGPASIELDLVPSLDLVLGVTDRTTAAETRIDAAGVGEPERTRVESEHPFCVTISADATGGARTDAMRSYTLRVTRE
jgi:serine/threonine-protein kinase